MRGWLRTRRRGEHRLLRLLGMGVILISISRSTRLCLILRCVVMYGFPFSFHLPHLRFPRISFLCLVLLFRTGANYSGITQWAGNPDVWNNTPQCAQAARTCQDFVSGNPTKFVDTFWEINSVRVYQDVARGKRRSIKNLW